MHILDVQIKAVFKNYSKHVVLDFTSQVRVQPHEKTTEMGVLMIAYTIFVTVMYLVNKDPTFHETAYGFLVFVMLGYDLRLNTQQKSKVGLRIFSAGLTM